MSVGTGRQNIIIVRLPLQPTTPHWETLSMAVRAILLPVCHHRTAQRLPDWIQTMFGLAVFYSTISIDDINAQSGWSLKTGKILLKWHVCFDTTHTIRHLFLTWTSLYPSLHFSNSTQSYAALPLAFFDFWLALLIWTVLRHISVRIKYKLKQNQFRTWITYPPSHDL